jgi:hypothetical protein
MNRKERLERSEKNRRKRQQESFKCKAEEFKRKREELSSRPLSTLRSDPSITDPIDKGNWKRFHCIKCDKEKTYPRLISDYPGYKVLCPKCGHLIGKVSYPEAMKIHNQTKNHERDK